MALKRRAVSSSVPIDWRDQARKRLVELGGKIEEETPNCPRCKSIMKLRTGPRGPFWGCSRYPACKGTREAERRSIPAGFNPAVTAVNPALRIEKMDGSPEQEAIWRSVLDATYEKYECHKVVRAYAGTGKTWTMIQLFLRTPAELRAAFIAFNKHIAVEANDKLKASGCFNVACSTSHSLGLRSVKLAFPHTEINDYKLSDICESIEKPFDIAPADWRSILSIVKRLCGFAKNYALTPDQADFIEALETIADHHGVEMNGVGKRALDYIQFVLREDLNRASSVIDYDDMIWLPCVLKLTPPQTFDLLVVDEAQDLNKCQQELVLQCCPTGRVIVVGDPFQSIYGFRAADVTSIPNMTTRLGATSRGVEVLPLTVTRRCPKKHVRLVQSIVPDIKALDDAPEGEIFSSDIASAVLEMKAGDMVICRVNAPLIKTAYSLIRRGVKAVIRGREIGDGLSNLVLKLEQSAATLPALVEALHEYRLNEMERLLPLGDKAGGRLAALADKCDCLLELISGVGSIPELKDRIVSLFADFEPDGRPKVAVVLGTVHRTKGLESERIFVLCPELIPHPMARQEWELTQELNLAYVAGTRCKFNAKTEEVGTLVFIGAIPSIYSCPETKEETAI